MNNPWVQAIVGSLIASILFEVIRRFFLHGYQVTLLIFGVAVSTLVFAFGTILEPAVRSLLEGGHPAWSLLMAIRICDVECFLLGLFVSGLLPGVVTGMPVAKGRSLKQRLLCAVCLAPVSLSIFDAIAYARMWHSDIAEIRQLANWGNVAFSLVSNIFGGVAGGLIIGSAVHLFVSLTTGSTGTRRKRRAG